MASASKKKPDNGVRNLRSRIETWRRQRAELRMPEEIWQAAVVLAKRIGVSRAAKDLGLGFYGLRDRVRAEAPGSDQGGPAFVELGAVQELGWAAPAGGAEIEAFGSDGRRLRLTIAAGHGLDVASVVAAFLATR